MNIFLLIHDFLWGQAVGLDPLEDPVEYGLDRQLGQGGEMGKSIMLDSNPTLILQHLHGSAGVDGRRVCTL